MREAVESRGARTFREVVVEALGEEAREVLASSWWLESKVSVGGTSLERVREQLALARSLLDP